jgi:hypothetical protein
MAQEAHSCVVGGQDIPKEIHCHISFPYCLWYKSHLSYDTRIFSDEFVTRERSRDECQSKKGG